MEISRIFLAIAIFFFGFLVALIVNLYIYSNLEHPLTSLAIGEASAPSDSIKENQIEIYQDKVILRIRNVSLGSYASTGSMRPLFDAAANGLRIVPKSENEINVGDIITFENDAVLIVHRVIEKGQDEQGTYFVTKGDNNFAADGKIRFSDIKYKTIGILY